MARPGFTQHRKFQRLARALEQHAAGVGGEVAAAGALELLWHTTYEAGNAFLGDSQDVEAAARWRGEPGALTKALLDAGGRGAAGFIEKVPGRPGRYQVHDLYDHAPEYVRKRLQRETERRQKGTDLAAERAAAGRKGAAARWQPDGKRQPFAMAAQEDGKRLANGTPPAPAPAPSPHPLPSPAPETSSPPARSRAAENQVLEAWNALADRTGLPKSRGGDKVRSVIRTRLRTKGWLDAFRVALNFIEGSAFHRGESDRGWMATLEWALKPGKAEELADKTTARPMARLDPDAAALLEAKRRWESGEEPREPEQLGELTPPGAAPSQASPGLVDVGAAPGPGDTTAQASLLSPLDVLAARLGHKEPQP